MSPPRKPERLIRTSVLLPESVWRKAKIRVLDDPNASTLQALLLYALETYLSKSKET